MCGVAAEAKFHVLAVDDSIIDRKLIERLLRSSSFQVTAVDSGSKALQFLGLQDDKEKDTEVNLIITDYSMPGMTGYELLRKIKESKSPSDIPVVIMSSENIPTRINRCLEEGAEEFFLKPVQMQDSLGKCVSGEVYSYRNQVPYIVDILDTQKIPNPLPEGMGNLIIAMRDFLFSPSRAEKLTNDGWDPVYPTNKLIISCVKNLE